MIKCIALLLVLLMVVGGADAGFVRLKDTIKGGDVGLFTQVEIEDGMMKWDVPGDYVKGTNPVTDAKGTPLGTSIASDHSNVVGPEWGTYSEVLIGVPNFFDLMPSWINSREDITFVKMVLYQGPPMGGEELGIYRVTTPWLTEGEDSGNVSAVRRMAGPGGEAGPWWKADEGKTVGPAGAEYDLFTGFSDLDYTTEDAQHVTLVHDSDHPDHLNGYTVDITEIVRDWWEFGNQGLVIVMSNDTWAASDAAYLRDSDRNNSWDLKPNGGQRATEFTFWMIPEPATLSLLALGVVLLRRRRK